MALYLGSELIRPTQSIVVEKEPPVVRQIIEGTISGIYSNSRINKIENYTFGNCYSLTQVSCINCSYIGEGAFEYCSSLTEVNFPNCSYIGSWAFDNCYSLTSINFPNCIIVNEEAFQACSALTSISLSMCTTIGNNAFADCSALTSINLPQTTTIESYAFARCYNLLSLYLIEVSSVPALGTNAFYSTPIGGYSASAGQYGNVYVPASLYSNFLTAINWSAYSSRIVSV